jgi:bifunctional non-homologous end joining protein LigD
LERPTGSRVGTCVLETHRWTVALRAKDDPDHPWVVGDESWLRSMPSARRVCGGSAGHELKLTNLDKPCSRGAPGRSGETETRHQARADPLLRRIAPTMLPHLAIEPLNLHRFPNGPRAQGFWQKDIPDTAPTWLARWHETGFQDARTGRRTSTCSPTGPRRCAGWATRRASRSTPGPASCPRPWQPTFAYIDIDPGDKTTWDETLVLARLYRTALGHLGVRGYPKTTGKRGIQIWIPIEPRYGSTRRARGSSASRARSVRPSGPGLVGVGTKGARRAAPGSTTPRTRASRRSSRRTRSGPRRAPGVGADQLGGA